MGTFLVDALVVAALRRTLASRLSDPVTSRLVWEARQGAVEALLVLEGALLYEAVRQVPEVLTD